MTSRPVALTNAWQEASRLDRADVHRDRGEWVKSLWYADEAKLLKITDEGRFTTNEAGDRLKFVHPFVEYDDQRHIFLGLVDDEPYFVVEAVLDGTLHTLREVGQLLSPLELDVATTASAITAWHRTGRHCANCGSGTRMVRGGFLRVCDNCGTESFPRTDPAVIVAIVDDQDRLLLARGGGWTGNRVSVLAGFVEAGESFEHAVHREMSEESDLELADLRYFGSQPWPYPRSIMVGFFARATTTAISIDDDEIVFADWFTRERLDADLAAGTLGLPNEASIARRLIETWRAGEHPYS
ncbi:NAD(+) diphosphatase [Propionibacteriaceae bacterium Y1685]|uniref:NAD(+) diphosphatase n=1 Tax=Microlunatus sp. Y1700 TaxID=3418487 RepID=UPI003B766E58